MSEFKRVSADEARILIDDEGAAVVDIRDPESFAAGRMEGARHLDGAGLADFLAGADPAVPVVVCCYHGHSSQGAAAMLAEHGLESVYSLDGGFAGWAVRWPDDVEAGPAD